MTTKTEEYDRRKNEAALLRAKLGLKANGSVGIPGRAALAAHMDAKAAGASEEEAFEAAKAALAEYGTAAPIPTAKEIARELADAKREADDKKAEERLAAASAKYGVSQATTASDNGTASHAADDTAEAALWPASTPTPAASAKPKDTPTEPTEKAPSPAKMATATAKAPTLAKADEAYLLAEHEDDAGNGDAMVKRYGAHFAYTGALGWLQYSGTHYEAEGAEAAVYLAAEETLRARSAAAIAAGKRFNGLLREATPTDKKITAVAKNFGKKRTLVGASFDAERHLLNCANGVLNLKSGKLEAHEPSQLFTYCIPTGYDASADREPWLKFLRGSIAGGEEAITWLQAWLGYGITGETNLDQFLYVHGPTRAGKGTFTNALQELLPDPLAKEISHATLTATRKENTDNFDLAPLRAARLLICEEANGREAVNASLLKKMTGGNTLTAAFKHRTPFDFRPQFKLIVVANQRINLDPDDDAAWARARVAEFPKSHLGEVDYSYREYHSSPAVLRGAFAWLVEGAQRYYRYGKKGIPTPACIMASTQASRDALDGLGRWLAERAKPDAEGWTANGAAYADYAAWAKDEDIEAKPLASFTHALRAKGFAIGVAKWHENRTQKGISGFTLKA